MTNSAFRFSSYVNTTDDRTNIDSAQYCWHLLRQPSKDLGKKALFAPSVAGKCSFVSHELRISALLETEVITLFFRSPALLLA